MNASGNLTAVNDFGADGVWARHTTTSDWFYTFDPQGCLSQKIGRDGSVLCSSVHDAQGHEATTDTHPDPFSGYGGQFGYYADWETSGDGGGSCLYLLGHRYYDPGAGRFLNRDPIGYDGGINLYAYVGNNPVNNIDPDGTYQSTLSPAECARLRYEIAALEKLIAEQTGYLNTPGDIKDRPKKIKQLNREIEVRVNKLKRCKDLPILPVRSPVNADEPIQDDTGSIMECILGAIILHKVPFPGRLPVRLPRPIPAH